MAFTETMKRKIVGVMFSVITLMLCGCVTHPGMERASALDPYFPPAPPNAINDPSLVQTGAMQP